MTKNRKRQKNIEKTKKTRIFEKKKQKKREKNKNPEKLKKS